MNDDNSSLELLSSMTDINEYAAISPGVYFMILGDLTKERQKVQVHSVDGIWALVTFRLPGDEAERRVSLNLTHVTVLWRDL